MKTYAIDPSFATLNQWASWLCIALAAFFIVFPFLPDDGSADHPFETVSVSLFGACLFGGLGWFTFRIARYLPKCSVSVDKDGLWSAHLSKEAALIPWGQIRSTKEHTYQQRLDLLDSTGNVLIKLEFQLADFEELRALVAEKIQRPTSSPVAAAYKKGIIYHVLYILGIAGLFWAGWYLGMAKPWIGYGVAVVLVSLIAPEYLTTVSRIAFSRDRLHIGYPFRTREVFRGEVKAVEIGDLLSQGARYPEVLLVVHGETKAIRLRHLGVDAIELQQILEHWREAQPLEDPSVPPRQSPEGSNSLDRA